MTKLYAVLSIFLLAGCGSLPHLGSAAPPSSPNYARTDGEPTALRPNPTTPDSDRYAVYGDDPETTASVPAERSTGRASKKSASKKSDEPLKPYSTEWWAKEKEIDDRLKKSMVICNGC